MKTRLYPFSMRNAHDIELYDNRLHNTIWAMINGEIPMDEHRMSRIESMVNGDLSELLEYIYSADGGVVWLPGNLLSLARRISAWAAIDRDEHRIHA